MLLLLSMFACKSPDADDVVCPAPRPLTEQVRAGTLSCPEELPTGPDVAARVGDIVLENSVSRWVIRTGDEGHAIYGLVGGGLVDAVRVGVEGQRSDDVLREIAPTSSFWLHQPDSIEIVSDGSDGEARVVVRGPWKSMTTVREVLSTPEPVDEYQLEYVLRPGLAQLDIVTTNVDGGEVAGLADMLFASGDARPWVPGDGVDVPQSGGVDLFALQPLADETAVAIGSDGAMRVLNIGPVLAVTYETAPEEIRRTVSLGADLLEAIAPFSSSTDVPSGWLDDGAGDWGQPVQEGQPAQVVVDGDAGVPLRITATRESDGMNWTYAVDGSATLKLPAGRWELFASRGPFWGTDVVTLDLDADTVEAFRPAMSQQVSTEGWVSADFHVHSEGSPDSSVRIERRLLDSAAEGLDFVVLTEHDFVWEEGCCESAPDGLVVERGVEISTMGLGHFNAWPITADPHMSGNGAVRWHGTDLAGMVAAVPDGALLQCNHPRFVDGGFAALFDWIALGPDTDPALIPCEAVELLNGGTFGDTEAVLADWMMLLNRDIRLVVTGVSDSHLSEDPLGHPRTLLRLDSPFTAAQATEALRAGHAVATAGPLLDLTVSGVGIGDTLTGAGGSETATVRIDAPDWMPLESVEVWVDGVLVHTEPVTGPAEFTTTFDVADEGSWVIALHRGGERVSPATQHKPWAVTNPVWLQR